MSSLIVPPLDAEPWPTLGPAVCDFIEAHWVYGPGSLMGQPYVIEPEFRAWLYRAYEIFPRGHDREGWRRFKRCVLSIRKGTAKTEKGAIVALTESHPEAPVRFDGWDASGNPVGRPVVDIYIPMMAYSKDQTEDLGYAVAKKILEESSEADLYDIQEEALILLDPRGRKAGEIKALSGSPNARDGARTSHQNFDETHRLHQPGHLKAHSTMIENTFKRRDADAWTMEQTTAPELGQGSIHESAMDYAEQIRDGRVKDPRLFFFHRQATYPQDGLQTREEVREYLLEASGPSAEWSADIEGLVDRWFEPTTDQAYFRRVWGNEKVPGGGKAFDARKFSELADFDYQVNKRTELITLGFDGARNRDSTALVATTVDSCYQWTVGVWERPVAAPEDWHIDSTEVTAVLEEFMRQYHVWRLYADPHHWGATIDIWTGKWTKDVVISYDTTKWKTIAYAVRDFDEAINLGTLSHDGNPKMVTHVGNCIKKELNIRDEDTDEPLWIITKERRDSSNLIDIAVASVLSLAARNDAIAAGARILEDANQGWAF